MLKSNLNLINRDSFNLCREFIVFVLSLQVLHKCDDPELKNVLIRHMEGDKNGFVNFFDRDIETISKTLMCNDTEAEKYHKLKAEDFLSSLLSLHHQ